MKNFKKIAFGLMVGALAIGFSAFTNAKYLVKPNTTTFYYILDQASGEYLSFGTSQPDVADNCAGTATHDCAIGFSSNEGSEVNPNSLPATPTYQSSQKAWYSN